MISSIGIHLKTNTAYVFFSLVFPLLILYFCNTVKIYHSANKAACFRCSVPLIIYIYDKDGCPNLESNQETGTTFSEI